MSKSHVSFELDKNTERQDSGKFDRSDMYPPIDEMVETINSNKSSKMPKFFDRVRGDGTFFNTSRNQKLGLTDEEAEEAAEYEAAEAVEAAARKAKADADAIEAAEQKASNKASNEMARQLKEERKKSKSTKISAREVWQAAEAARLEELTEQQRKKGGRKSRKSKKNGRKSRKNKRKSNKRKKY